MAGREVAVAMGIWLLASPAVALELTSPEVVEGYGLAPAQVHSLCGGGNVAPTLAWTDAPPGTLSFAVTVYDPDAQGGWWHWIVTDIPAAVRTLSARLPPGAVTAANDFGARAYGGACPPPGSGPHHYQFTVWALGVAHVPVSGPGSAIGAWLAAHALARATLTAVYQR